MGKKLSYVSACPFNYSNDHGERVLWEISFKCTHDELKSNKRDKNHELWLLFSGLIQHLTMK